MADDIDATNDRIEVETTLLVTDACRRAAAIPAGEEGDCYYCGEHFTRVVFVQSEGQFACGRCRDKRGLA